MLNLVRRLRDQGIAVVLISHRMPDVFAVADRIIVLRRGTKVADKAISATSPEEVTGPHHRRDHHRLTSDGWTTRRRRLERAIEARSHGLVARAGSAGVLGARRRPARRRRSLSFATDAFATPQNLFNVTRNFAFVAIVAIGMTAVIISGGIDLSVGSILCLSAMVTGGRAA